MKLLNKVTFEEVKNSKSDTVYYSSRTFWWTDDPEDLQKSKPLPAHLVPKGQNPATYGTNIPCDIFGAPLYEMKKERFLDDVGRIENHYGSLEAFMAMHHKNFKPDVGDSIGLFAMKQTFIDAVERQKAAQLAGHVADHGWWVSASALVPPNEAPSFSINVIILTANDGPYIGYVDLESGQWYRRGKIKVENVTYWMAIPPFSKK